MAKRKMTKGHTTTYKALHKTKDRVTRTPLKPRGWTICSQRSNELITIPRSLVVQSFIITIACTQYRRIMRATFTQKTFVDTKAVNKTTDNTMAKWKSAIILEISSSKNIHLKQQLPWETPNNNLQYTA
jgi:hypothetical protein